MEPTLIQSHWKIDLNDLKKLNQFKERVSKVQASLCSERALFYTHAFIKHDQDSYILKKAKAFAYTLENMSLYVDQDSRIVGNMASSMFAAPVFLEYSTQWIKQEIDTFSARDGDVFKVSDQVKKDIESVLPFWENKTHQDNVLNNLTPQIKQAAAMNVLHLGGISMSGDGHIVPDYPMLLKKGVSWVNSRVTTPFKTSL